MRRRIAEGILAAAPGVDAHHRAAIADIVGMANVDGDADGRSDVVAVGRARTADAGLVFVGIATETGVRYWSWSSSAPMVEPDGDVWLADVDGDGRADLVTRGAAVGDHPGRISVGWSDGVGFTR